jgi:hypothetical protein
VLPGPGHPQAAKPAHTLVPPQEAGAVDVPEVVGLGDVEVAEGAVVVDVLLEVVGL